MSQLVACHSTDSVDEILMVQVFEPILVRIVHVGTTVELMSRGILNPILVTSILGEYQDMCNNEGPGTYSVLLFIEHKGSNSPTLIGTGSSLSMNMDGSMANAEMVGSTRDGAEGRRH